MIASVWKREPQFTPESGLALPALLFGLPALIGGIWMGITMSLLPIMEWRAAQDWAPFSCRIESFEAAPSVEGAVNLNISLRYTYRVGGTVQTGTRLDFGNQRVHQDDLPPIAEKYAVGAELSCFVDPDDPTQSVLETTYPGMRTVLGIAAALLTLLGVVLTWIGFRWTTTTSVHSLGE